METAVEKVKRKLWQFGYSVKTVAQIPGVDYDLLVDGKYQVKVLEKGADLEAVPRKVIVAIVDGDEIAYQMCQRGKCWEESSPLKAFPKVEQD